MSRFFAHANEGRKDAPSPTWRRPCDVLACGLFFAAILLLVTIGVPKGTVHVALHGIGIDWLTTAGGYVDRLFDPLSGLALVDLPQLSGWLHVVSKTAVVHIYIGALSMGLVAAAVAAMAAVTRPNRAWHDVACW